MRVGVYFKISPELLEDIQGFKILTKNQIHSIRKKYYKRYRYFLSLKSGYDNDDFIRDLRTVILTFNAFRIARFMLPQKRRKLSFWKIGNIK